MQIAPAMTTLSQRLKFAREQRFSSAAKAAAAMGVPVSTYVQQERGVRGVPRDRAEDYAKFFKVSPGWLLFGRDDAAQAVTGRVMVPLVGYVGQGSQAYLFAKREAAKNQAKGPAPASETTRAIEIRTEDGLGPAFEGWLAYFDEADRGPVKPSHHGALCIVALTDGRTLVRRVQASRTAGLYHLTSGSAEPLLDQEIEWAARIEGLAPR